MARTRCKANFLKCLFDTSLEKREQANTQCAHRNKNALHKKYNKSNPISLFANIQLNIFLLQYFVQHYQHQHHHHHYHCCRRHRHEIFDSGRM